MMKKIIYSLTLLITIGVLANFLFPTINSSKDLKKITQESLLTQKESDYLVYFYQDTCSLCLQLDPLIVTASAKNIPIYKVDMADEANQSLWYDWASHHEQYDVRLGVESEDGTITYDEGINPSLYSGSDWDIQTQDGVVLATHNKAYTNSQPETVEDLKVAGTPQIIHVHEGTIRSVAEGYIQSETLLNDLIKRPFSEMTEPVEEEPIELLEIEGSAQKTAEVTNEVESAVE